MLATPFSPGLQTTRTLAGLVVAATILAAPAASVAVESQYSPGGWATLHKGPGNRKQVNNVSFADNYSSKVVVPGSSVLTAPVLSPDGQQFYFTTGQGDGYSNLHAFTIDGDALWSVPAVDDNVSGEAAGVDGCAILSSPIVDAEGDIYISDCDQVWAFKPDGSIKWVVEQPLPPENTWQPTDTLMVNAFTTAVFTSQGDVMGITNYGSVRVLDRDTGRLLNDPMILPGLQPPMSAVPLPDSMLGEGVMNPELRVWAWQLLMGGAMPSANTPSVDINTGRVFVAVTSNTPGNGALVGLDVVPLDDGRVDVQVAWITDMGPGSGSSPSLSPEGSQVYVSDELGMFYGIDTSSGEVLWTLQTASAAASVAVGADGVVYSLQQYAPAVIAMSPTGERLWETDISHLVEEKLGSHWLFGDPVGSGSGNPTITNEGLIVPIAYGYSWMVGERRLPLYVKSSIVLFDTETGKAIRDVTDIPDDSSGITVVLDDGTILSSLGAVVTSSVNPLRGLLNWLMPGDYDMLHMVGGLHIARPE